MSWTLQTAGGPDNDPRKYILRDGSTAYIISPLSGGSAGVVHELSDGDTELGRISQSIRPAILMNTQLIEVAVIEGTAKLEAIDGELKIMSGAKNPRFEAFSLQPLNDGRVEVLLLRDDDIVSFPRAKTNFTCTWEAASEVQVNSSAAETGAQKELNGLDRVTDAGEEETEDEDLDKTCTTIKATQTKSQPLQPTPQLSEQHSIVVQETPTTDRVGNMEYARFNETDDGQDQPIGNTPTPYGLEQAGIPFSTARTGQTQQAPKSTDVGVKTPDARHSYGVEETPATGKATSMKEGASSENQRGKRGPKVVVARKRATPAPDETEPDQEQFEASNKRAKRNPTTDDNTQDSNLSNIVVDTSPAVAPAKKGRKRKSVATDHEDRDEGTPQPDKTSQRATSVAVTEPYHGETPCVATSNSAITDKSHAVKFLKKQGGSLVDSVKDSFNILWHVSTSSLAYES